MTESSKQPTKIAHLRAQREMTLEDLALRSGLSVGTVRGLEKGLIRSPRLQTLYQVARGLGVDVTEILEAATA